jgi:molecular chaperone Hsp33
VRDELLRTLDAAGNASIRVLSGTGLVQEAVRRHATSPTASVALGRALMGVLLLASEAKDGERVQLQVRGDGALGTLVADAESGGTVRGYVQHPDARVPFRGEELGVGDAIGRGVLSVERQHPSWKRPYRGVVPLDSGEIAQDLARYLLESEQKPSAVALGVYLGPTGEVEAAGGYLVQRLPGADDAALAELERGVAELSHPSALLRAGASAEVLLGRLVAGVGVGRVDRVLPRFACRCDLGRVRRALAVLGRAELREAASRGETLEIRCAFCAEIYRLGPDEVAGILPDA